MSRSRARILLVLGGLLAAFLAGSGIAVYLNSDCLDAVTVRFTGPGEEPRDPGFLGLAKESVKPDYRLDFVTNSGSGWKSAQIPDRSAVDGLRFPVTAGHRLGEFRELVLVEDDVGADREVARVSFAPPSMSANGYVFGVESSRSFEAGLKWYFTTPVGFIVFVVLLIVGFLLVG